MRFLFWLLVLAGNLGLVSLVVRLGPRLWASARSWVDMFAPDADWPALATAGVIVATIWSIS